MKANSVSKRVLSLLVLVVMLFSCWVFTAPTASAAASGGSYYVQVAYTVDDDSSKDGNWFKIYYTRQDGTEGSETYCNKNESGSKTKDFTLDGAPYKVTVSVECAGGSKIGGSKWRLTSIKCWSNSAHNANGKTLFSKYFL